MTTTPGRASLCQQRLKRSRALTSISNAQRTAEGTLEALRSLTTFASKTDGVYKQGQDKAQVAGDSSMFQVRSRSKNISRKWSSAFSKQSSSSAKSI